MGARVLDPNGKEVMPIMGCYGIGIERILTAAIEQSNDAEGFWLPVTIAPFTVVVTITNVADAVLRETGEKLASELESAGLDVLLDDRDDRAGVKFKDADLVGIPYRGGTGDPRNPYQRGCGAERSGCAGEEARGGRAVARRRDSGRRRLVRGALCGKEAGRERSLDSPHLYSFEVRP
jgi:prolyl-tRNA synthetase